MPDNPVIRDCEECGALALNECDVFCTAADNILASFGKSLELQFVSELNATVMS